MARTKSATELSPTLSSFLFPFLGQLGRCLGSKRDRRWELSLSFPHPCPRLGEALCLLSNLPVFMGTPARLSRGQPLCPAQVFRPEHPAHPAAASGLGLSSQPPTFSWALLNFFCTCFAKRPAAPPARPSAILLAPPGAACPGPAPCGFLRAPREGSAVPVMPRIRPGGPRAAHPAPLSPGKHPGPPEASGRAWPDAAGDLRDTGPGRWPSPAGRSPGALPGGPRLFGPGHGPGHGRGARGHLWGSGWGWVCSQEAGDAGLPSGGASSRPASNPLPLR